MLERSITDQIMDLLERIPASVVLKLHGSRMQSSGWPDVFFSCAAIAGRSVWIEVKKPGEKPRRLQQYRLKQLRGAKAIAISVDTVGDVRDMLSRIGITPPPVED